MSRRRRYRLRLPRSFVPVFGLLFILGLATGWQPLTALRQVGIDLSFVDASWLLFPEQTVDGEVTRVFDGDTIEVRGLGRVRFHEIDTPEKNQPYGDAARSALAGKIAGKRVRVEVFDTDRYGRKVAKVWLGDRDINRELVREGHAWAYRQYLWDGSLIADERAARQAGMGLWADSRRPVPPWEWRRR